MEQDVVLTKRYKVKCGIIKEYRYLAPPFPIKKTYSTEG